MNTRQGELTQEKSIVSRLWENRGIRVALQILLIIVFSCLTAVAKKIHPSLGIPGSSGVFWLTMMVIGRSVTRWDGAGFLTGVGVGLWGIPIGLEHTLPYDIALYSCAGLMIDLTARIPKINIQNPLGAMLCGFTAHMAKFGFIVYGTLVSSVTKHFLIVGMLNSALLHAAFGIAAGILGWGIVKTTQYGVKRLSRKSG